MSRLTPFVRSSLTIVVLLFASGCGSATPGAVGGFVSGPADDHCSMNGAMTIRPVGVCVADTPGGSDAGANATDGGAPAVATPLHNSEGYDDACKFHVAVTSTPVRQNEDVTFTLTVVGLSPAGPATGAEPYTEVTLGDTHVSPSRDTTAVETPAGSGVYEIGPIRFDKAGQWIVRFHMFGGCSDAPTDSPHARVGFLVDVP